ncbi:MAG: RAD55 family ATPase [Halosimplex sp.]
MSDRVSTGVPALDRELDGGVPTGTIVAFLAEPASRSELFLERLAAGRETLYLTVDRTPTAVSSTLRDRAGGADDLAVESIDGDAPTIDALRSLSGLEDEGLLIVDPVGPLERADPGEYRAVLSELRTIVSRTASVAVLHALKHDDAPDQRHRTEHVADVVFDLLTAVDGGNVENRLLVPKFRDGRALTDPVRVTLTDRIAADTSRDVA